MRSHPCTWTNSVQDRGTIDEAPPWRTILEPRHLILRAWGRRATARCASWPARRQPTRCARAAPTASRAIGQRQRAPRAPHTAPARLSAPARRPRAAPPLQTPCASPTPGSCGGLTPPRPRPAGVAGKIAAFSSGVAPVRSAGGAAVDEELQTVSEVLHKLEAACRVRGAWLVRCCGVVLRRRAAARLQARRRTAMRPAACGRGERPARARPTRTHGGM